MNLLRSAIMSRRYRLHFSILVFCFCVPLVRAAEGPVGDWDVKMDIQGNEITAKLSIVKKDDGSLGGTWTGRRGESELQNVKFENGKLTFSRAMEAQGQSFNLDFDGTIEGDKITGNFITPMGELPVSGVRAGAAPAAGADPLVGSWDVVSVSQLGERKRKLTIKEDMSAVYRAEDQDFAVRNLKRDGNDVTFSVTLSLEGQELPLDFKGKLDGSNLTGTFNNESMGGEVAQVKATKAAAAPAGGAGALAGNWEITSVSQLGTLKRTLAVNPDGTATYNTESDKYPVKDLKIDGENASFNVTVKVQDQELPLFFKGKVSGSELKGDFHSDDSGNSPIAQVTGTKKN